ncbi:hypothetical protein BN1708_007712 [Verticillium longisporum]|uniref:Uncharacterized protein n=1 Tax=Verticillium longisporum TaxID=100787 RepID=A0A0G4MVU5_VERLO|nr:hypothetical protein BN1708_007712 [Verticillium longisporum]
MRLEDDLMLGENVQRNPPSSPSAQLWSNILCVPATATLTHCESKNLVAAGATTGDAKTIASAV